MELIRENLLWTKPTIKPSGVIKPTELPPLKKCDARDFIFMLCVVVLERSVYFKKFALCAVLLELTVY
jgi:hypothetical protein